MVRPPGPQEEDRRRVCRERRVLVAERTAAVNRIRGLLFAQGIFDYEPMRRDRRARLEELTTGDGRPLPAQLKAQIVRELARLELAMEQVKAVEAERDAQLAAVERPGGGARLDRLAGVGAEIAGVLTGEAFWRRFDNRRQLAAYAGLAPTPWKSGGIDREQGISGGGNPRLRTTLIQLAWLWLKHQPDSELSQWFRARTGDQGGRFRKVGIVALARKLLVALWRFHEHGEVPAGAKLSPA